MLYMQKTLPIDYAAKIDIRFQIVESSVRADDSAHGFAEHRRREEKSGR